MIHLSMAQDIDELLHKMRDMINKIENFNKHGVMEGATEVKQFTSMKEHLLDICDAQYSAEIKEYSKTHNKVRTHSDIHPM